MDGVTFLRKIMALRPMPVVMISTLTQAGAEMTLEALETGAVDFIAKPTSASANAWPARQGACDQGQARPRARVGARRAGRVAWPRGAAAAIAADRQDHLHRRIDRRRRGAQGVLMGCRADCPPILITQHMPPRFTASFAAAPQQRMRDEGVEATHDQVVSRAMSTSRRVRIISRSTEGGRIHMSAITKAPVSGHRPSVDVLFGSARATSAEKRSARS